MASGISKLNDFKKKKELTLRYKNGKSMKKNGVENLTAQSKFRETERRRATGLKIFRNLCLPGRQEG